MPVQPRLEASEPVEEFLCLDDNQFVHDCKEVRGMKTFLINHSCCSPVAALAAATHAMHACARAEDMLSKETKQLMHGKYHVGVLAAHSAQVLACE